MKTEVVEIFDISTLEITKSILRQAGIAFEVKNEYTLQLGNVYALGNNGATVWVGEKDLDIATNLLVKFEILELNNEKKNDEFEFVTWIQRMFDISFLRGTSFLVKLLIPFIALVIVSSIWGYNIVHKKVTDFIGNDSVWCMEFIEVDEKRMIPNSTAGVNNSFLMKMHNLYGYNCNEEITFRNNEIILPGIDNQEVAGTYKFNRDYSKLSITLKNKKINQFYNGEYKVEFDNFNHGCTLISHKTKIQLQLYNY